MVRRFDSFARFLQAAALMNGQVTNVAGLSRDAAVARPTVQGSSCAGSLRATFSGSARLNGHGSR